MKIPECGCTNVAYYYYSQLTYLNKCMRMLHKISKIFFILGSKALFA